jgi:hypothetical protein
VSGKSNKLWLEEGEIANVIANSITGSFDLVESSSAGARGKIDYLEALARGGMTDFPPFEIIQAAEKVVNWA